MTKDMRTRIAWLALAALVISACGDVIEIPKVDGPSAPVGPGGEDEDYVFGGDVVFSATFETPPDGSEPGQWAKGATISVYDGEKVVTASNTAEDGPVGRFPARIKEKVGSVFAVSPALEGAEITAESVKLEVPTEQRADAPAPVYCVAKTRGNVLFFRNLLTVINISAGFEGADRVEISVEGAPVAGTVEVDYSGEDPVVTATSSTITLTGALEPGKSYPVVLAPGKLDSYSVVAYSGDKAVSHVSGLSLTLGRGQTLSLPPLSKDVPAYRITNMWVWGGTGPEYGGTGVIDIFTKQNYFTNVDGRGIGALLDNYLEIRPDGTFMNWAGEDGRNWWFVYSGTINPETGKDLDLAKFYDVLPRAEGTYVLDGASLTFTRPDGSTSSCTVVPGGTYTMTDNKTVTIAEGHIALRFAITNGKDNWTYNFRDYDKIACRPRALFIELEQMPDGFIVPAASRTTDADFEYTEPDPAGSFDWNSLPGTWNVYGGNEAPYGIWVLGGSGDDPAFVSPINKNWCWDGTIKNESDNELTISVTGLTGTAVSGTLNWTAGADGAFWNYKYKDGRDLSGFYDKIPKGESAFTADIAAQKVTLSNGETPKFLLPGSNVFAYNKAIEIPDKCFGLAFHLMDPIAATSDRWTDVDRFINAPLEYVIIFEKP